MKNKKLLGGLMVGMMFMGAGNALAQEADYTEESPQYILVMWGQNGINLNVKDWIGSIKAEQAEFSVAKEILINSGEKLKNTEGDLGKLSDDLEVETSSKYRKGVILRVFEEKNQQGKIAVQMGNLNSEMEIEEIGAMSEQAQTGEFLRVANLQNNDNLSLGERNRLFSNKLVILKSTIGMEAWATEQLDSGKISQAVAESLRMNLDKSLGATFDNDNKVADFEYKYARLRNLVNQEKIAPGVAAGAIQRLVNDAQN